MLTSLRQFIKDESGAIAIEYAMVVGLLGVGIIVTLDTLGDDLFDYIHAIANQVKNVKDSK